MKYLLAWKQDQIFFFVQKALAQGLMGIVSNI